MSGISSPRPLIVLKEIEIIPEIWVIPPMQVETKSLKPKIWMKDEGIAMTPKMIWKPPLRQNLPKSAIKKYYKSKERE